MDVYDFINGLIEFTKKGHCKWVDNNDCTYTLQLNNGSVLLRVMYDSISDYTRFEIKLFDSVECFASYVAENFDQLYGLLDKLYDVIKETKKIEIEKKMSCLYSDIENL